MDEKIVRTAILENCVTLLCTAGLVIGLYALGAGAWCFWGLVLLLNLNSIKMREGT